MIKYELLNDEFDTDITGLDRCHHLKEIEKYFKVSDNFFNYVLQNKDVFYYKIKTNENLVGAVQIERNALTIFLAIWIKPEFQHKGIATRVLKDIIDEKFDITYNKIIVAIEKINFFSIKLFQKVGFKEDKTEDDLIYFVFDRS